MQLIETERLILRHFTLEDAPFIDQLFNDPDFIRFIGDRNIQTTEDARQFLEERLIPNYEKFGFGFYLVATKELGTSIGMCGLVKRDFLEDVDIGYAFLPIARGKGYALEAAQATMAYGKNELHIPRIVAITSIDNTRSMHLLQKLGLYLEGTVNFPGEDTAVNLFGPKT